MTQRLFRGAARALQNSTTTGGNASGGYRLVWRGADAMNEIEAIVQAALLAAVQAGEKSWRRRVRTDTNALRDSARVEFDGLTATLIVGEGIDYLRHAPDSGKAFSRARKTMIQRFKSELRKGAKSQGIGVRVLRNPRR